MIIIHTQTQILTHPFYFSSLQGADGQTGARGERGPSGGKGEVGSAGPAGPAGQSGPAVSTIYTHSCITTWQIKSDQDRLDIPGAAEGYSDIRQISGCSSFAFRLY